MSKTLNKQLYGLYSQGMENSRADNAHVKWRLAVFKIRDEITSNLESVYKINTSDDDSIKEAAITLAETVYESIQKSS